MVYGRTGVADVGLTPAGDYAHHEGQSQFNDHWRIFAFLREQVFVVNHLVPCRVLRSQQIVVGPAGLHFGIARDSVERPAKLVPRQDFYINPGADDFVRHGSERLEVDSERFEGLVEEVLQLRQIFDKEFGSEERQLSVQDGKK